MKTILTLAVLALGALMMTSSITATRSITAAPNSTNLQLSLSFEGCTTLPSDCYARPFDMQVVVSDTATIYTGTFDDWGAASVLIPEENVDVYWWVQSETVLAQRAHEVVECPPCKLPIGFYAINGDATGDNLVSVLDFNAIRGAIGTCPGVHTFGPDLNNSGCVTVVDYNLMRPNMGRAGDPEWPSSTPTPTATATPTVPELEQRTVDIINERRVIEGLPTLRVDAALLEAARRHSNDIGPAGLCQHNGTDGSTPWTRIAEAGYTGEALGEVVGCGYPTAEEVVQDWWNSPSHHDVLVDPYAEDIACGWWLNPQGFGWQTCDTGRFGAVPTPTQTP